MNKTVLYLVPTPIGNLDDITYRAVKILKAVDLILAEDTRTSGKLLSHYGIDTKMQSYHAFNEHKVLSSLIEKLKNGIEMALITDAGTPGISDPGFLLLRECLKYDLKVECLPGPTSVIPALIKSGLPSDQFIFEGFLPHKKGKLTKIKELLHENRTVVFFESPHRLLKTLGQLQEILGSDRLASVSRELTKMHEETINGTLNEILQYYQNNVMKGEVVLVIGGAAYSAKS